MESHIDSLLVDVDKVIEQVETESHNGWRAFNPMYRIYGESTVDRF